MMSEKGKAAFVTGGASGIGQAVVEMLVQKGVNVFIADQNTVEAEAYAKSLNQKKQGKVMAGQVNIAIWGEQVQAFGKAIKAFGRIDYVYPIAGIGERKWLKSDPNSWIEPDLTVVDVDLKGQLYTCSLAIQHFRRQEVNDFGFRGKIFCVASICGFYCIPTLPIYTAAKHGVTGFVRSYGKFLPEEKITLNAISPAVVRTGISSDSFYKQIEDRNILTPMESLIKVFESLMGDNDTSGEIFECGPRGTQIRQVAEAMDAETQVLLDMLVERARPLQAW
ncbi:glucose 1-dehydrogenase [Tothia fuscella]|uniref:Glucose 1-dehydrogenase n=1 Tax=Tothia fuscella TaxID=1048955 RepID=A0A9P4NVQ6_9PEZI|nr:glucose 1-dehydrogenase [Tothia fuscella]